MLTEHVSIGKVPVRSLTERSSELRAESCPSSAGIDEARKLEEILSEVRADSCPSSAGIDEDR